MEEIKSLKSHILHQSPASVSPVAATGGEATKSVEDVSSHVSKPSTTRTSHFKTAISTPEPCHLPPDTASNRSRSVSITSGLFGRPNSALDGRQALLKRKASVLSTPTTTTPARTFSVGDTPRTFTRANFTANPFSSHTYAQSDPRRKMLKGERQSTPKEEMPKKNTPKKG
ncbi:hypothetical protein FPHYL_169 [Fusarium phyllophilum]|uniref:Uncharacterized protein n=1 Tax=Fusarium phyllophilum TaxID=47803 RepID=A0A8H5KGZ2_9HYPO|nr:hypothetical protein FPHYL_169 [Fusarium phyllophilum]